MISLRRDVSGQLHVAASTGKVDLIRLYVKYGDDINATNDEGQTPLHLAYKYGHAEAVAVLIELHADQTLRDKQQRLAVDLMCVKVEPELRRH